MRDIDERGMRTIIEEALRMAGRGTAGYHVSLDMDWIDPEDAPGVGTPVRGGATYREAHLAMEIIADHGRLTSFEIVEVNPVIDEHNRTANLAVELILTAFGKKILSPFIAVGNVYAFIVAVSTRNFTAGAIAPRTASAALFWLMGAPLASTRTTSE